jgi:hypothetical protein
MTKSRVFKFSVIFAIAVNIVLLSIMTINYAHRGIVEPFVYISHQTDVTGVLIDRTERPDLFHIVMPGMRRRAQLILTVPPSWERITGIITGMTRLIIL